MNIIITTIIKKVAWYGESKHKLIYPCPIGIIERYKHMTYRNWLINYMVNISYATKKL